MPPGHISLSLSPSLYLHPPQLDMGVGAFVAITVFVHPIARVGGPGPSSSSPPSPSSSLLGAVRQAGVLIALGLMRAAGNASVNYPLHVTEYGVHWNFFMTLALVLLLLGSMQAALAAFPSSSAPSPSSSSTSFSSFSTPSAVPGRMWLLGLCGAALLALHQLALSRGLTAAVLTAPRTGLVSANKEGLASLAGYLALALLLVPVAARLNVLVLWTRRALQAPAGGVEGPDGAGPRAVRARVRSEWLRYWACVGGGAAAALALLPVLEARVEARSRMLCNAAYVLWVGGVSLVMLATLGLADLVPWPVFATDDDGGSSAEGGPSRAWLLPADPTAAAREAGAASVRAVGLLQGTVNDGALAWFVLSNLLTGATNLAIDTLSKDRAFAAAWLFLYVSVCVGITAAIPTLVRARARACAARRRAAATAAEG